MANEKKRGLGKGISSLMSGFDFDTQTDDIITKTIKDERKDKMTVVQLDIGHVRPNPNQPRKFFDEEALEGLAESIKSQGIIQPLTVEEIAPGEFSIIAGERRYRAAKIAGLDKVPAIVVSLSEVQRIQMSLIENIQRENLNAIEEASAYQYLIDHSGFTQEMVAQKVGKSRSAIANSLRLLSLSDKMKDDIVSGAMSAGHARAILSLINPADRELLRDKIVHEGLSVRDAEILAESYNKGHKLIQRKKSTEKDTDVVNIEEKFVSAVGARVEIKGSLDKGKLQIKFKSQKDLERLYALLSGGGVLFDE
ncbi:MAG: ParB/RepB/Spo0J family partition protein [Spirochaetales bacterium]|nr:ParB/RepB/Spo0J family partition protein [Spirochaetales bacterium]MDD6841419.1 ParB/RepB/Spo0J family partition protein [Spirochaetales bacterium]